MISVFVACNGKSSAEATSDSTINVLDSQKIATKDSVSAKSDSNKKNIDSSFKALKDSVEKTK